MPNCIFCKIINKEIPSSIVAETDLSIAFLDVRPVNKGHVLVIPKEHYLNILDIPEEILKDTIALVQKVCKGVSKGLNVDNINVFQRNGKGAGQEINHLHFHVLPRYDKDELFVWSGRTSYKKEEDKEYLNKIKNAIL